jgi:LysM repeat protein
MRARGLIPIILLNVIISLVVAFGAIAIFNRNATDRVNERLVTVELIVTATTDPDATPFVVTATAQPGDPQIIDIPSDTLVSAGVTPGTRPTSFRDSGENTTAEANESASNVLTINDELPPACIKHTIVSGDSPSGLAVSYGVNLFDMMAVNNLTEESARLLAIDQVLIIPLDGCPIEMFITTPTPIPPTPSNTPTITQTSEPTATHTPEPTITQTPRTTATNTPRPTEEATATSEFTPTPTQTPSNTPAPTVTLAATVENSQINIEKVTGAGDITRESLEIRNYGISTDISGWSIVDIDGNKFTFSSDVLLFQGGSINLHTRAGENRPIHLYWGLDSAIFEPGDIITLIDREGNVHATFRVP